MKQNKNQGNSHDQAESLCIKIRDQNNKKHLYIPIDCNHAILPS